jgi:hypothetical protein
MSKFSASVKKTSNTYVSVVEVIEIFTENDCDGYVQLPGKSRVSRLEVHGHNSYSRAVALADLIGSTDES